MWTGVTLPGAPRASLMRSRYCGALTRGIGPNSATLLPPGVAPPAGAEREEPGLAGRLDRQRPGRRGGLRLRQRREVLDAPVQRAGGQLRHLLFRQRLDASACCASAAGARAGSRQDRDAASSLLHEDLLGVVRTAAHCIAGRGWNVLTKRLCFPYGTDQCLRIGEWWADRSTNELGRGGETVRLEPKAMEVLMVLAARAGQVVSREELLADVWPGVVVGDEALTQSIIKLRRALGDNPRSRPTSRPSPSAATG